MSDEISDLLSQITHDDLGSLSNKEFEEQLGQNSAALKLWNLLCRNNPGDKKWGIGPTIASKIMARKRPHLIPIHDSVVKKEIGQRRNDKVWRLWWEALTEDSYLETCAEVLRQAINRPELSTLRTLDVLLWMSGKNKKQSRNSLNSERRRVTGA